MATMTAIPNRVQEQVFVIMQKRKLIRRLQGPQKQQTTYHITALAVLFIIIYSGMAYYTTTNDGKEGTDTTVFQVTISITQILGLGVWFLLIVMLLGCLQEKYRHVLCWMGIYWPVLYLSVRVFFRLVDDDDLSDAVDEDDDTTEDGRTTSALDRIATVILILVEVGTFLIFVFCIYIYPYVMNSTWITKSGSPTKLWKLAVVVPVAAQKKKNTTNKDDALTTSSSVSSAASSSSWTLEYSGRNLFSTGCGVLFCGRKRYECRYVGDVHPTTHLPHGRGIWSDNAYDGEVLTGVWHQGHPVGPFTARLYGGVGSMFQSLRIAFFMGNDDTFTENQAIPTNALPPRCGVAAVECSVAGDFYSHLPKATLVEGYEPRTESSGTTSTNISTTTTTTATTLSIGQCCHYLDEIDSTTDHTPASASSSSKQNNPRKTEAKTIQISCNDSRGIQISGYKYNATGNIFTKRIQQIVIDVVTKNDNDNDDIGHEKEHEHIEQTKPLLLEDTTNTIIIDEDDDKEKDDENNNTEVIYKIEEQKKKKRSNDKEEEEEGYNTSLTNSNPDNVHFDVKNWTKIEGKDTALIFIPGYNSWLEQAVANFGQMCSMSKLPSTVFPILYAYPGGSLMTYRWASAISASDNNKHYFRQMLIGLQNAGIRNIHILTHSLGVQTLMNVFADVTDGHGNDDEEKTIISPVARLFQPALSSSSPSKSNPSRDPMLQVNKLVCRSITMMNPDFPVLAFREHGFRTLRRVTSMITVIGDRFDQALFWSSVVNGFLNAPMGLEQPSVLNSIAATKQKGWYNRQCTIGQDIDMLDVDDDNNDVVNGDDGKSWLDCDVIDTTGLDTNVNDLRHHSYSMNSILIRDLEELIVSGKRASDRSSLLHKTGNVYEYCHAPAFVKPE